MVLHDVLPSPPASTSPSHPNPATPYDSFKYFQNARSEVLSAYALQTLSPLASRLFSRVGTRLLVGIQDLEATAQLSPNSLLTTYYPPPTAHQLALTSHYFPLTITTSHPPTIAYCERL